MRSDANRLLRESSRSQLSREKVKESGHAVAVLFMGTKEGRDILVIKNSWGTESHGAKGWLLMEAEAANLFQASFYDVYWTLSSLKKHPRATELFKQYNDAPDDAKADFNEYCSALCLQQAAECEDALLSTMGVDSGFQLQFGRDTPRGRYNFCCSTSVAA